MNEITSQWGQDACGAAGLWSVLRFVTQDRTSVLRSGTAGDPRARGSYRSTPHVAR